MVSAGHVGGTHGSDIVCSAADVLWMSVVRGMLGVGGVCEMCMCLTRARRGCRWGLVDERIGFGLYQSCGNRGSVGRVSVFWLRWCRLGVCRGLDQDLEGWGGVMYVWAVSLD